MPKPKSKVKKITPLAVAMALAILAFPAYAAPIINAQPATSCDATGFCKTTAELAGVLTASQINNLKSANITQFVSKLRNANITDVSYSWSGTALTVTGRISPNTSTYWLLDLGTVKVDPWWNFSWNYAKNFTLNETYGVARTQGGVYLWFNGTDGKSNCTDIRIVDYDAAAVMNRTIRTYQLSGNGYNCSVHFDFTINANQNKTFTLYYNSSLPDTNALAVTYDDYRSDTSSDYQSIDLGGTSNATYSVSAGKLVMSCTGSCNNLWGWRKPWIQQGNFTLEAYVYRPVSTTNVGLGSYLNTTFNKLSWEHTAGNLEDYLMLYGAYTLMNRTAINLGTDKWVYMNISQQGAYWTSNYNGSQFHYVPNASVPSGYPSFVMNGPYSYNFDNVSLISNGVVMSALGAEETWPLVGTNITLMLNGAETNYTGSLALNMTATANTTVSMNLTVNGTIYNTSSSPLYNTSALAMGYYNVTASWAGNVTHPAASRTLWANITTPVIVNAPVDTVACFATRPICIDTYTGRVFLEGNPL